VPDIERRFNLLAPLCDETNWRNSAEFADKADDANSLRQATFAHHLSCHPNVLERKMLRFLVITGSLLFSGCALIPGISHQPTLHNPFPQLSKVAVAPFFNLSHEATLNGRRVAMAYFNELQTVPGFQVVPVGVVERAMQENRIELRDASDARKLAQILNVDAIVVGAVTDYSPYYPPRMGMQVQWIAANPNFHPIPPGYGLPWGTPGEEDIPPPLLFEAEMAFAKAQLKTQTPPYEKATAEAPPASNGDPANGGDNSDDGAAAGKTSRGGHGSAGRPTSPVRAIGHAEPQAADMAAAGPPGGAVGLPPDWPDPRGFIPPPPGPRPSGGRSSYAPVLQHTRVYNGQDADFTQALENYYYFRDDARLGGWQSYLQRSDDFVRFCCHMHIWEMLSARGGAGETRVVWRWSKIR
jgi:hypothetical protein